MYDKFNRLALRKKLMLVCGALTALSFVVGGMGFFSLKLATNEYGWLADVSMQKIHLSDEMYVNFATARVHITSLGLPGLSQSALEKVTRGFQDATKQYERAYKKYLEVGLVPGSEELDKKVELAWASFKDLGDKAVYLSKSANPGDREKLTDIILNETTEKSGIFATAIDSLIEFQRKEGNLRAIQASSDRAAATTAMLSVIVVGLVLSSFLTLVFSQSMGKALFSVVEQLTRGNSELSAEVSQLTHSSTELSAAATQQASAIQQTSASVEEIRAMVDKNSENATYSAESSKLSRERAEKGQKVVAEMIESMTAIERGNEKIMDEIMDSNKRISEVVHLIQEIGSKTKVINDIVFQTKLLSFNASVEAARAGEQGKGFAVVAEEVGNLAQMSGNAAKEISVMLDGSVSKVEGLVRETKEKVERLMAESKTTVTRGGEVARQCGDVLGEIVSNAREVSEKVREISAASAEQASGVGEISKAIQELDTSTQSNAATALALSSSAQSLSGQVEMLKAASQKLRGVVLGCDKSVVVERFVWRDQYALGINAMDNEHKVLIERINSLAEAIESKKSDQLTTAFQSLSDYTREHFSDEEQYLASINYPDLTNHREIHKKVLAGLDGFGEQARAGKLDGEKIIAFLNDWLIRHILGVDMKYARFAKRGSSVVEQRRAA